MSINARDEFAGTVCELASKRDDELSDSLRKINNVIVETKNKKKKALFWGAINANFVAMYNQLYEKLNYNLYWIDNAQKLPFTYGVKFNIPLPFVRVRFPLYNGRVISEIQNLRFCNNDYLDDTFLIIRGMFPLMESDTIKALALDIENYVVSVFSIINPQFVLLWNKFYVISRVVIAVARKLNIPIIYIEAGSFPSTIAIETIGQMGESVPAVNSLWYNKYEPITRNEYDYFDTVIKQWKNRNISRNKKEKTINLFSLLSMKRKKTIFYAGQIDSDVGIYPYNKTAQKFHSPSFSSSMDALIFLSELAKNNDWNLIYKPHPIAYREHLESRDIPDNVIYITEGDINDIVDICDVCVTILSTTAYVALVREKPVVMLGYIQLRGQGCTYEAFEKNQIEQTIKDAIKYGYTSEQKRSFVEHTARMCKYYLFDNLDKRELRYGQPLEKAIDFINNAINGEAEF
jgi:capsule polysaccharide modification protein KpsS